MGAFNFMSFAASEGSKAECHSLNHGWTHTLSHLQDRSTMEDLSNLRASSRHVVVDLNLLSPPRSSAVLENESMFRSSGRSRERYLTGIHHVPGTLLQPWVLKAK